MRDKMNRPFFLRFHGWCCQRGPKLACLFAIPQSRPCAGGAASRQQGPIHHRYAGLEAWSIAGKYIRPG